MDVAKRERSEWFCDFAPGLSFPGFDRAYFAAEDGEQGPVKQIEYAAGFGFKTVFDTYLMRRPVEEQELIGAALSQSGIAISGFVLAPDTLNKPIWCSRDLASIETLERKLLEGAEAARRVGATRMVVLTARHPTMPFGEQLHTFADNLRVFAPTMETWGLQLCIESASRQRAPHLLIERFDDAYTLVRLANSPAVTLMFDVYHIAMTDGDIIGNLVWAANRIGAIQLSDVPARLEPGSGGLDFPNILAAARRAGYNGPFELEHFFSGAGRTGLDLALKRLEEIDDAVATALKETAG